MSRRESTVMIALLMMALLGLTGCASKSGKVRVSGKTMCEAHGGMYNAATQQCTYAAQPRSVRQSCQAQGGYYDDAAQFCEMGPP
jgi:hypothetical protein